MISLYQFIYYCITLWISIKNTCSYSYHNIYQFFHYLSSYSLHNTWIFITNYDIPICLSHIYEPVSFEWKYSKSILYHNPTNIYRLSWLSANIHLLHENESVEIISMDSFIEEFRIYTENKFPSLFIIFITWCIYHKKWVTTDFIIHIINSNGEEQSFSINKYNILSPSQFYKIK